MFKLGFYRFAQRVVSAPDDGLGASTTAATPAQAARNAIMDAMLEKPKEAEKKPASAHSGAPSDEAAKRASQDRQQSSLTQNDADDPATKSDDKNQNEDAAGNDGEDDVLGDDIFSGTSGDAANQDADDERGEGDEDDSAAKPALGDSTKLSVTVDGEEVEVTLGDLKRRYAGEGAIEKRLQTATEYRNASAQDYERMQTLTNAALQKFGQNLFRRIVPQPSDDLRIKNPTQYLLQKDMFDKETAALNAAHQELHGILQQVDAEAEEMRKKVRQQAHAQLMEIMPVFKDKVKGPKVRDALIDAAREIGYTDKQIADCTDPLMFKVIALAARELRRQKSAKAGPVEEQTRTMRARNGSKQANVAQRQEAAAFAKARKTGNLADIAATMLVQAPKKRR